MGSICSEMAPCTAFHTGSATTHRDVRKIDRQYLLLGKGTLKLHSKNHVTNLSRCPPQRGMVKHTHHLHGDGGSAGHHAARHNVLRRSAQYRKGVNSRMVVESAIFRCEQCGHQISREAIGGDVLPPKTVGIHRQYRKNDSRPVTDHAAVLLPRGSANHVRQGCRARYHHRNQKEKYTGGYPPPHVLQEGAENLQVS